jgi:putative ABC transport system permease protein
VSRVVVRGGIGLALVGMACGLAAALLMTRSIQSLLFDVPAIDPLTFSAVVMVLTVAAILASWLPARRAARVDPVIAMRAE